MALTYSSEQTITLSPASLANNSARESTAVDNSTNLFIDADLYLNIKTGASGVSATGYVNVYLYCSHDGSAYPDTVTGSDAAITLTNPTNLIFLGAINAVANATSYDKTFPGIGAIMGGKVTKKWGIVLENKTAAALDTTAGNFSAKFTGITY